MAGLEDVGGGSGTESRKEAKGGITILCSNEHTKLFIGLVVAAIWQLYLN